MALHLVPVSRIIEAAARLDVVDPEHALKDPVNQAIRLGAVQNDPRGKVNIGDEQVARIDELLADAAPAIPEPPTNDSDPDALGDY